MSDEKKNIPRTQSNSTVFPDPAKIREQAERKAQSIQQPDFSSMTFEEIQQQFHELQVKQIKAELQIEQLRSQFEERDSEASLYRIVTDNMLDMVALTDMEGNFTFAGKSHEIMGYDPGFLIGKNVMDFVHPGDLSYVFEEFTIFLGSGENRTVEYRYQCKNGKYIWLETIGKILKNENCQPKAIVFSSRDITERKQAEKALVESENKSRLLAEEAPVSIIHFDKDGMVTFVNRWHIEVFAKGELDRNFFLNKKITDLPGIQSAGVGPELEKILEGETVVLDQVYIPKFAAGHEGYQYMRGVPFFYNGEISGGILIREDITECKRAEAEQKKLQTQLVQAQKMESVGRLAGGVAHDFNNKLAIINGYAELTIEMLDPDEPARKNIQEIFKAGKRSADIVRQLLAFAKKQTISPVKLDLNDTISSMLKMLQRLIGENIELTWHPGNNLWPVKIDPSQVDQIMANLAVNARDAISDVGKLTIETKNVVCDEQYCKAYAYFIPGQYVMLAVSDDGCGMETEIQDNLFEPFFTTKEIGKGTGLGLSTIYGIVKQNNGFINVYSEPGIGTTFKIYLPRYETNEVSEMPTNVSTENMPTGSETILLVEDETPILQMARTALEQLGYTVLTAANPKYALELARDHGGEIHLLITDVVMPEMNGRDLALHLADDKPDLKTLYMSGYTADVVSHHRILDKDVLFMQKPFSLRDLAVKVREAIEKG